MLCYKYRVYPTNKQVIRLNRQMFLAKELYNILFEKCKEHYNETGTFFSQFKMCNYITQLKKERPEFKELYARVAQNVSKRLGNAYKAFFRRTKEKNNGKNIEVGFPRIKNRVVSLSYPQRGFKLKSENRLYLSRIGNIPIVLHRIPKGKTKICFIKKYSSGKWYVGFANELPENDFERNNGDTIGIDLGLTNFVTASNGEKVEAPQFLRKSEKKLKLLHHRLSRKKFGSSNRQKARLKLARQYEKISNQRFDFLHKLSTRQVKSHNTIVIENLNVQNMKKNKSISKSINDASWGIYKRMLHYKAWSAGCEVIEVNARDTTRMCSSCGNKQDISLSERTYTCPSCGMIRDRDVNAAKNILARGMDGLSKTYACGDLSSVVPVMESHDISLKQELYGVNRT